MTRDPETITIPGRFPSAMASIHKLPVELLSRVFIMGTQHDTPYPDFPTTNQATFEVAMSHVCRHWRDIALHTQSLWSTVHFRLQCHMERAEEYFKRGGRHLIDILVDTCAEEEYVPEYNLFRREFKPIFDLLQPQLHRWRSLSLKVRDRECKLGARNALSSCGPAPFLEYLHLWHIENWENVERLFTQIGPPPVVIFDRSLPRLRHISLVGVNVPWTQSPFLEGLLSVDFALHSEDVRIPYDVWYTMLTTSPDLHKLSLTYSGPKLPSELWPTDIINLPNLRELFLTDLPPPYLCEVLRRLSMPRVQFLRLELPDAEFDDDFTAVIDHMAEPPPPPAPPSADDEEKDDDEKKKPRLPMFPELETLAIYALGCHKDSFRRFLQRSATVKRLEMGCTRIADGLFEELLRLDGPSTETPGGAEAGPSGLQSTALAPPTPTGVLLPALHTVRVSGISSATLRAFIDFRRNQSRPVKRWLVSERMRDTELERVAADMVRRGEDEAMSWFQSDEDEEEDGDEEEEEDEEDYASEEEEEDEGAIVPAPAPTPALAVAQEIPVYSDDEPVEYSDDEEDEDEEEEA